MKLSAIESIAPRLQKIESRENAITDREKALNLPLAEQNDRFEKLRKGYISLKLIEEELASEFQPITRETFLSLLGSFQIKYGIDRLRFDNILDRDKIERYFSELIPLIQTRWSSICGYKRLWKNRRIEYQQQIDTLLNNDMKKLAESIDAIDQSKWIESVDIVISKLEKLIQDIEELLTSTESLQTEMEELFKLREDIFAMAHKLFEI
jgi:hypothetical protein